MKILICDDDKEIIDYLKIAISEAYGDKHEVYSALSADDISHLSDVKNDAAFDIAFMGVEMNSDNGMALSLFLKNLYTDIEIIYFTDSTEKYYEELFDKIKPFGLMRTPLEKEKVCRYIDEVESKHKTLRIKNGKKVITISLNSIVYIERTARVLNIVTLRESLSVYMKMNDIEPMLSKYFIRCHNSFIVNGNYILKMTSEQFQMMNGSTVNISRKYMKTAKECFWRVKGNCI